jgi:hypothetical protein
MSFTAAPDPPRAFAAIHLEKKGPSTFDTDVSSNRAQTRRPAQAAPQPKGEQPTLIKTPTEQALCLRRRSGPGPQSLRLQPVHGQRSRGGLEHGVVMWYCSLSTSDQSAEARPNRGLEQ